jgi:hypothetical protein
MLYEGDDYLIIVFPTEAEYEVSQPSQEVRWFYIIKAEHILKFVWQKSFWCSLQEFFRLHCNEMSDRPTLEYNATI